MLSIIHLMAIRLESEESWLESKNALRFLVTHWKSASHCGLLVTFQLPTITQCSSASRPRPVAACLCTGEDSCRELYHDAMSNLCRMMFIVIPFRYRLYAGSLSKGRLNAARWLVFMGVRTDNADWGTVWTDSRESPLETTLFDCLVLPSCFSLIRPKC